jgi:hypothetical protein
MFQLLKQSGLSHPFYLETQQLHHHASPCKNITQENNIYTIKQNGLNIAEARK